MNLRCARGIRMARGWLRYGILAAGALVFSTPFAWLALTSVKDNRDLVVTSFESLIPKVTETRDINDPVAPSFSTS